MSLSHHLCRRHHHHQTITTTFRRLCSTTPPDPSPSTQLPHHEFLSPTPYRNSWTPPNTPKQARSQLAALRRQYDNHLKEFRINYIREMEIMRIEKLRKDKAKKEALRIANEARKADKAARKKAKAKERELADQQLRLTLLKERAEKLEYWREREKKFEEKKKAAKELTRRKSSMWIDEVELEKKLLENFVETTSVYGRIHEK
ncbi:hypothetical protein Leryth_014050 [Lithospermum erythrorhizon]|nr:hypothetical protein Leryth_014050 [Lithospermum erythrorhizon]